MITMLLRGLLGWCPCCGKGRLAKYPVGMHRFCAHCGLEFENAPGDFTGASVMGYGVTSLASLALGFGLYLLWEPPIALVLIVGILFIIVVGIITYLPMKGLWIAFLVYTHALKPPGVEDWS